MAEQVSKNTKHDFAPLVSFVAQCLGSRMDDADIRAEIKKITDIEFDSKVIKLLMQRAKKLLHKRANINAENQVAYSVAYWEMQVSDKKQKPADRNYAQVQLQNLLGIGASFKKQRDEDDLDEKAAEALLHMSEAMEKAPTKDKNNG